MARVGRVIYFDHNAATPCSPSVCKSIKEGLVTEDWMNPSSSHKQSQILRRRISDVRNIISNHLACSAKNIYFTSGGTESINTVLSQDTLKLNGVTDIITSKMEHHATLNAISKLKEKGISIHFAKNNNQGEIDLGDIECILKRNKEKAFLLSFLTINNETGVKTDVKLISQIAKKYQALFHIDTVQSLGKEKINLEDLDVDFASFSGHKIGSLKGVGLLYAKSLFTPLICGDQERGMRGGTYNFPAIYSLKLAIEDIDLKSIKKIKILRDYLELGLLNLGGIQINGTNADRVSNTSNIHFQGISNEVLRCFLLDKGICVSTGSACNSSSFEPSYVIQAMGFSKEYARSSIRISLSKNNTKAEVEYFINATSQFLLEKPIEIQAPL